MTLLTGGRYFFVSSLVLLVACSSPDSGGGNGGSGPAQGGGSSSGGRQNGAGGNSSGGNGAGGAVGSGGSTSGGQNSSGGGQNASGGNSSSGGSNSGGANSSGGKASGGNASGGANSNGGSNSGGANSSGGKANGGSGNGGSGVGGTGKGGAGNGGAGNGGAANGGSGTGGSGKGGATSTACSFPSAWNPSSPTYTTYDLPNATTACGYSGSNNTIQNIVNGTLFAAIPGNSSQDFNTANRCGACVQIGSAIITIVDECPYDGSNNPPCKANPNGHLDLSKAAASAAGVTGDPNNHNQAAWKFVPCPVNGNVKVRLKTGNNNEFFIENEILPIASVTCDGGLTGSRTFYGAWHFDPNVAGKNCTATDISNRTISFTVGTTQGQNVDTGVQFPKCN